jgi:hypothetical protein
MLILALTGAPLLWMSVPPFLEPLLALLLAAGWFVAQGFSTLVGYLRANPYPRAEGMRA